MKIILVRHGESTANVAGLLSSAPSDEVSLTDYGRFQVEVAAKLIRGKVDYVYVSPLLRTIETANIIFRDWPEKPKKKIDARISEINYGEYGGGPNNPHLDSIRESQIFGDYLIRFGDNGENKFEILTRLYDFLIEVIKTSSSSSRVVVVSHGSIIGWLERIIIALGDSEYGHTHVANTEVRIHTLRKRDIKKLSRHRLVDEYCAKTKDFSLVYKYRSEYIKLANLYNDAELESYVLEQLLKGLFESNIIPIKQSIDRQLLNADEVVAVCALHNSSAIVGEYISHYIKFGVKNFVFIDNGSDDMSIEIIKSMIRKDVFIDIWQTKDIFDGFKAMGWKQRMFNYYGLNRWYLNLDVDEFVVYINYKKSNIYDLIRYAIEHNLKSIGGVLVDMYSDGPIISSNLSDESVIHKYRFFDTGSYTCENSEKFGLRIFGGPRTRLFDRHPSLQKFPLTYIDSETIAVNPHFWYPYTTNQQSELLIGLLHYKFLPGDIERYVKYVDSGVHWDGSSQYRSYVDFILANHDATFYNERYSTEYIDSKSLLKLVDKDGKRIINSISDCT